MVCVLIFSFSVFCIYEFGVCSMKVFYYVYKVRDFSGGDIYSNCSLFILPVNTFEKLFSPSLNRNLVS